MMRHVGLSPRGKLFQRVMVHLQIALEDGLNRALGPNDSRAILCHRGSLDPLAYWLDRGWQEDEFFTFTGTTLEMHYQRYAVVLHLVTAADGAAEYYKRWPDAHRRRHPHFEWGTRDSDCRDFDEGLRRFGVGLDLLEGATELLAAAAGRSDAFVAGGVVLNESHEPLLNVVFSLRGAKAIDRVVDAHDHGLLDAVSKPVKEVEVHLVFLLNHAARPLHVGPEA